MVTGSATLRASAASGDRAGAERPQRRRTAVEAHPVHHQRGPGMTGSQRRLIRGRRAADGDKLDRRRHVVARRIQPVEDLSRDRRRVDVGRPGELPVAFARPQPERGDHAEEARPRAPGRPEQVGVGSLVAPRDVTVGGHHLDRVDGLGRPAPAAAVPAHPALQQEPAEPDGRAVPAREEAPAGGEERVEVEPAAHRGPDGDDPGLRLVVHAGERREVDQQRVLAQRPGGPAVPARADGDPPPLGGRQPHPGRHVRHAGGTEHGGRPPRRPPLVEDPADRGVLEPGVRGAQKLPAQPANGHCPASSAGATSSMRLPSGSVTYAIRMPGSGASRGSQTATAPCARTLA